jgi:DNA-binding transcriptional MerR regulator
MKSKSYTTTEAAKEVGVSRATIQSWIKNGLVRPPQIQSRPENSPVRLWTAADVARLKSLKGKIKTGRPRKKKQ